MSFGQQAYQHRFFHQPARSKNVLQRHQPLKLGHSTPKARYSSLSIEPTSQIPESLKLASYVSNQLDGNYQLQQKALDKFKKEAEVLKRIKTQMHVNQYYPYYPYDWGYFPENNAYDRQVHNEIDLLKCQVEPEILAESKILDLVEPVLPPISPLTPTLRQRHLHPLYHEEIALSRLRESREREKAVAYQRRYDDLKRVYSKQIEENESKARVERRRLERQVKQQGRCVKSIEKALGDISDRLDANSKMVESSVLQNQLILAEQSIALQASKNLLGRHRYDIYGKRYYYKYDDLGNTQQSFWREKGKPRVDYAIRKMDKQLGDIANLKKKLSARLT